MASITSFWVAPLEMGKKYSSLKVSLEQVLAGTLVLISRLKIGRLLGRPSAPIPLVGGILAISYRRMLSLDWLLKGLPNLWDQSVQTDCRSATVIQQKCISTIQKYNRNIELSRVPFSKGAFG